VLVVPKFVGRAQDVKLKAAKSDISMLKSALALFEQDNGASPTTEEGLQAFDGAARESEGLEGALTGTCAVGSVGQSVHVIQSSGAHVKDLI